MSEHVDWITSKAACYLPQVFQDLEGILRKDVEIANRASPFAKNGHNYSFDFQARPNQYRIQRIPPAASVGISLAEVAVTLSDACILLEKGVPIGRPELLGKVTSVWNAETGQCELQLNATPCEHWHISHAALNPLVF